MATGDANALQRRYARGAMTAAIAAGAVATVGFGVAPDLLFAALLAPAVVALRARLGWAGSVAFVGVAALAGVAGVATVSAWLGVGLFWPILTAGVVAFLALSTPHRTLEFSLPLPTRRQLTLVAASLAGSAVWLLAVITAAASRAGVAWAMQGDFALNTSSVRRYLAEGGAAVLPTANPRPLEHIVVGALTGAHGDYAALDSATRLQYETHATVHAWVWAVGAVSFFGAVLAYRAAHAAGGWPRRTAPLAALVASLVPLGPVALGDAIALGHLNTYITAATLVATLTVTTTKRASASARATGAALGTTVAGLVWTPLAIVPAAVGAVALARMLRSRRERAPSRRGLAALVASLVAGVAIGGLHVGADALGIGKNDVATQASFISAEGYFIRHPVGWAVAVAALTAACALLAYHRDRRLAVAWAVATTAALLGLAALVSAQGHLLEPWHYYPSKYLAITLVAFSGPALGWAWATLGWSLENVRQRWVGLVAATALATALVGAHTEFDARLVASDRQPATRIQDPYWYGGTDFVERVYAGADDERYVVYWRAGTRTRLANHVAGTATLHPRRGEEFAAAWSRARQERDWQSVDALCGAAAEAPLPTVALTQDDGLADEVAAACPELGIDVRPLP